MNKAGEENRSVRNTKKRLREGLLRGLASLTIPLARLFSGTEVDESVIRYLLGL